MKINMSNKILLTSLFVIQLVLIFLAFIVIQNSYNGKANALLYITLIVLIIPAVFTYYISTNIAKSNEKERELQVDEEQEITQQETITQDETSEIESEETIDFKKLLPVEKTNPEKFAEELLQNLANEFQISQGLFFIKNKVDEIFNCIGQYAYYSDKSPASFKLGETLSGQAVKNKNIVTLSDIPANFMTIASGLGSSSPRYLTFVPILYRDDVVGLIEFASFKPMSAAMEKVIKQLADKTGDTINKIVKK